MFTHKRLSEVFKNSLRIPIDDNSKIALMSDCHRAGGGWSDDFSRNQNLFYSALTHYYNNGYMYIEIGDGDELWEERNPKEIIKEHNNVFLLMSKLYKENRFYMLYGNHDRVKEKQPYMKKHFSEYFDEWQKSHVELFNGIQAHEGIVLEYKNTGKSIFLVHGHQGDLLNDTMWKFTRFLVRYLWRPLEAWGINDPTDTAKNYVRKNIVEQRIVDWSKKNNQMIVTGHTHRPTIPMIGEPLYFNSGSSIHPHCITAIEITEGKVSLVKWCFMTREDDTVYVGKTVIGGPVKLEDYFNIF